MPQADYDYVIAMQEETASVETSRYVQQKLPANVIILPSGPTGNDAFAQMAFRQLRKTGKFYLFNGRVVQVTRRRGRTYLDVTSEQGLRTSIEEYATLFAWRADPNGSGYLIKPCARLSVDHARMLLASPRSRLLPEITRLHDAAILIEGANSQVVRLEMGFDEDTGILITRSDKHPIVTLEEAVRCIDTLIAEFSFATPADKSRAVAAIIAPTLCFGRLLDRHFPLFVMESDASQSGKNYFFELVQAVYRELATMVTQKNGGVGSFDESLSEALLVGRSIILIDNVRGAIRSQFLEALLTCAANTTVPARVPHKGEFHIDPRGIIFQLTSNGFVSTRDLSNRSCLIRIRKRQNFEFRAYPEGDLLDHVRANQALFLAAVHRIVMEWMSRGRPRTNDIRGEGRFREFFQVVDWITQFCGLPAVLDGHPAAQEQVSNSGMEWLRQLAPLIEESDRLDETMTAGALARLSIAGGLTIPGLLIECDDAQRAMKVGRSLGQLFKGDDTVQVDAFELRRVPTKEPRPNGTGYMDGKGYRLTKTKGTA